MWLNGPTQWEDHKIGKKHRKNLRRRGQPPKCSRNSYAGDDGNGKDSPRDNPRQNIVSMLPDNELDEAISVIKGEMSERFNVTIRWHESHFKGCPYCCNTAAQIAVPQAPAPCLPGPAPVKKMPEMAAVKKIVGPVEPPPPPPVAKSDHVRPVAPSPSPPPPSPSPSSPSSSSSSSTR